MSSDLDLVKCPKCAGGKESWGLGMIWGKCTACKGIGYVEIKKELTETKRGRRSKSERKEIEEKEIIHEIINENIGGEE